METRDARASQSDLTACAVRYAVGTNLMGRAALTTRWGSREMPVTAGLVGYLMLHPAMGVVFSLPGVHGAAMQLYTLLAG